MLIPSPRTGNVGAQDKCATSARKTPAFTRNYVFRARGLNVFFRRMISCIEHLLSQHRMTFRSVVTDGGAVAADALFQVVAPPFCPPSTWYVNVTGGTVVGSRDQFSTAYAEAVAPWINMGF